MIVTVVRPYGGAEGKRVRVGTQFWVKKPGGKAAGPKGVLVIEFPRFQALKAKGMIVEGETDQAAPVIRVSTPRKAPVVGKRPAPKKTERDISNQRHKAGQNGGQTGKAAARSSSPAVQAPPASGGLLGQRAKRGQRASDGSPSTTPSNSAPGQTANMQQTGDGGDTTPPPSENGESNNPPPFL